MTRYLRGFWRGAIFTFVAAIALFIVGYNFHLDARLVKLLGIAISAVALVIMLWPLFGKRV
ncbi:MAG: hypothetical protein WAW96_20815 [Alphaproteobacteria bacterium]